MYTSIYISIDINDPTVLSLSTILVSIRWWWIARQFTWRRKMVWYTALYLYSYHLFLYFDPSSSSLRVLLFIETLTVWRLFYKATFFLQISSLHCSHIHTALRLQDWRPTASVDHYGCLTSRCIGLVGYLLTDTFLGSWWKLGAIGDNEVCGIMTGIYIVANVRWQLIGPGVHFTGRPGPGRGGEDIVHIVHHRHDETPTRPGGGGKGSNFYVFCGSKPDDAHDA